MLVINANINTMANGQVYENGFLKAENGKISALGHMKDLCVGDESVIDAESRLLFPGFIDSHTHLGMCEDSLGFEGDDLNEMTDPATPQLRAIDAVNPLDLCFREALEAGVTSVVTGPGSANPISGQMLAMKTRGNCVDEMVIKAPAAMKLALGENPKGVYHERKETPMTRMATAALIRGRLQEALQYKSKKESGEDFEYSDACEALIPLLNREIPAHIHAHRLDDIATAIRIAGEFDIDFVIVHGTGAYLAPEILAKNGVSVMSGPLICERSKPELKGLTPKCPGILYGAGVKISIVTDHPVVPVQYLALCAGLAVREGLPWYEALKAITINAASLAGIDGRVGSLEIGKDADFVLFAGNPLTLEAKPDMVVVEGEIMIGNR